MDALSLTEAKFFATISSAEVILFLCSVLTGHIFPPSEPIMVYKYNKKSIKASTHDIQQIEQDISMHHSHPRLEDTK